MEVKRITKSQLEHFNIFFNKFITLLEVRGQGVRKRCRLSWLTNSSLVYEPKCGGGGLRGLTLIKKKIKFSSNIRKFRMEQLQSHIWLTASSSPHIWGNICAFPHIFGSPSSYMTMQLLHSEFPYI